MLFRSPENFNEEMAKQKAYEDARYQLWPLAGFMLAEDIHRGCGTGGDAGKPGDCAQGVAGLTCRLLPPQQLQENS